MKGFLLAFSVSALLMLGLVFAMVSSPNLFTNLFSPPTENETSTVQTTSETETESIEPSPSYQKQLEKGKTLYTEGHYDLAAQAFSAAIALDPNAATAYLWMGKSHYANGNLEEAAAALEFANTLQPNEPETQQTLAKTWMELGKTTEAGTLLASIQPQTAEVVYLQGILKAYLGNYDEATLLFQTVIDSGESSELSQHADNFLNSISEFKLAEDAPLSYQQTLIARSLAETGENALAVELIYTVLQTEPDYRDAWIILGYVYLDEEQYNDAQEALLKAIELDPTKAETRYFLGLSYFGLEDYESAVLQLELAIESGFEPRVQAYQKLGDAAVLTQDYLKAVEAYENVLILNSSDVNLYIRPIWLYLDHLNNPKAAHELAEEALKEHPESAMAYNLMGWVQTVQEDYENAEENLNYALILDPNLAAAYLNYGRWCEAQEFYERAKENYKRAYTLDSGGSIGNLAGERYNAVVEMEASMEAATEPQPSNAP